MFGGDLEKYLLENVNFESDGTNQDIYYNVATQKFWIHRYFGNESLSPGTEEDNVLLFKIRNNFDFEEWNGCFMCENHNTPECPRLECMAESLYENIRDSGNIDLD